MDAFLTIAQFRTRTVMPPEDVDRVEAQYPGFIDVRLADESAWLRARLIKRYPTAFDAPIAAVILGWLTDIVTPQVYRRRGWNPSSGQDAEIDKQAERARAEVLEAANSETGLFELPMRENTTASGVSKGGPLSYSEQSPYSWTDVQADAVRGGLP